MSQQNNYAGTYGGSSSWTNPGNGLGAPNASLSGLAGDNPSDSYVYFSANDGLPAYFVVSAVYIQVWMNDGSGGTASLKHSTQTLATQGGGGEYTMGGSVTGGPWPSSAWPNSAYVHAHGDGNGNPCRLDALQFQITWDYVVLNTLLADDVTNYAPTSATINGRYNANGDGDTEYRLVYKASGGSYDTPSWTSASGQTGTVVAAGRNLSSLTPGTTYFYKIQARNTGDVVYESAERTFQTNAGTPAQNERVREVLSRRLWLLRRPTGIYECNVPLSALDADIHNRIDIVSPTGPHAQGIGWRAKEWQRRRFSVQRITVLPGDDSVKLTLLDRRLLDIRLWDTGMTSFANLSGLDLTRANGVARISHGAGRSFSRTTKVWIVNGADSTRVIEMLAETPGIGYQGELFEDQRTNYLLRSSGVSGTTGLTLWGTGVNGSSIASDTSDSFFNPEVSADPLKFTAGNPNTTQLEADWPATQSIGAGSYVRLTIDYKMDSSGGLYWALIRGLDSWQWDNDSAAFISGSYSNAFPTQLTRDAMARFHSKRIPVGASNTALTLAVFYGSGGPAGRVAHVYHAQIEIGTYATSRIVTDSATYTREKTSLTYDVTTGAKVYDPAIGTFFCEVIPFWASADLLSTEDRYIYYMETNGGADHDALFFDASTGKFTFERKVGASTYVATVSPSPNNVAGLWGWWKGDAGVEVEGSGGAQYWRDQSGNGHDWYQGTLANQPTPVADVVNGLPVLRFDGSNDYMSYAGNPGSASGEVFIVVKIDNDPPATDAVSGLWDMGTSANDVHFPHPASTIHDDWGSTTRKDTPNPPLSLSSAFRIYGVRSAPGAWANRIDGTDHFTTATNAVGWRTTMAIGAGIDAGFYLDGDLAEMIIFDRVLSASDRAIVENYLRLKYNLAGGGISRDAVYKVACRWTGGGGELDKPNYSMTVFLNGTPGADVTSAAPTFTSPETLHIGQNGSVAQQFNGIIRERRVFPVALLDEEIRRLP